MYLDKEYPTYSEVPDGYLTFSQEVEYIESN